ncbi:radical SAM protein [Streptomyces roseochromogenus]|uniref:radical SAM protein n=1 Tax=Streptomyces roseochromogenus TaxID=285450 RepID=UPI0004CF970D|nr:radical SAM protein [Streptomyces roseochromogenus]
MTYSCPLRCTHCYSESGRRPSRQLDHAQLLQVTDALISLRPLGIALTGGEPLLVKGLLEVAGRITRAEIPVVLYTSGWNVDRALAEELLKVFHRIAVSLDGATAGVHNRIRGRARSFESALSTLSLLDEASRDLAAQLHAHVGTFGIDCSLMRSNIHQLEKFCTDIVPRFPAMRHLVFGVTVPSGLANRAGFAERELLDDALIRRTASAWQLKRLQSLAPGTLDITVEDNRMLMMHPDDLAKGWALPAMQVEPDGGVRAMPIYEGTVGNILDEDPNALWKKAVARRSDPFVVETLTPVRTMREWAEAARRIDHHFGTAEDRARIARRPEYR